MAELLPVLREPSQHDHDDAALLPHHLPEVGGGVRQRTRGGDVGRVARVVVRLPMEMWAILVCFIQVRYEEIYEDMTQHEWINRYGARENDDRGANILNSKL